MTTNSPCILHSDALTKLVNGREASVESWLSNGSSPVRFSDDQILNDQPREPSEDGGNDRRESSSDDHPSVTDHGEDGLANEQEPEPVPPCHSPRRQLPSRAAKDAVARPDAYTGSPSRKQVLPLARPWSPKLSTTPIPVPVVPRRAREVARGRSLHSITENDASPSPAPHSPHSRRGAGSPIVTSGGNKSSHCGVSQASRQVKRLSWEVPACQSSRKLRLDLTWLTWLSTG